MPGLTGKAGGKLMALLTAPAGLNASLASMTDEAGSLPVVAESQITAQNMAIELAERSTEVRYPAMHIYCQRVANRLKEKFRKFSGTLEMVVEVRVSQDRMEGLEQKLQAYVEAVTEVLDRNRGDWGEGLFYTGGYEVTFNAVKRGGKNFVQVAKVAFDLEASRN
jgi:hypothetical protein